MKNLDELQTRLGVRFQVPRLLEQAFTHTSYVNEQRPGDPADNERLEFLGDAVLELSVSDYLYRNFPDRAEGELTKMRARMVCEASLYEIARKLELGQYIRLGRGEEQTGGRQRASLLADVFESLVGSLYLDQGLQAVLQFLNEHVLRQLAEFERFYQLNDHKSELQELIQQRDLGQLEYRIAEERGPAHDREFVAEVLLEQKAMGLGSGKSKKEAEQRAAAEALGKLGDLRSSRTN